MRDVIKVGFVALVLSLSLAAPVAAGPFEDGVAARAYGDYATALRLLRPLANQGHAAAQFNLGFMYAFGRGVPQDYAEAMRWFRKAADQGDASSQFILGGLYDSGEGVPQDYVKAHKWYNLAGAHFSASESGMREQAVKNRDRVAAKMTTAQIAEAQRLAREWKPK
jgi:uncharacterized protein